jgi:hypothetical protein
MTTQTAPISDRARMAQAADEMTAAITRMMRAVKAAGDLGFEGEIEDQIDAAQVTVRRLRDASVGN